MWGGGGLCAAGQPVQQGMLEPHVAGWGVVGFWCSPYDGRDPGETAPDPLGLQCVDHAMYRTGGWGHTLASHAPLGHAKVEPPPVLKESSIWRDPVPIRAC